MILLRSSLSAAKATSCCRQMTPVCSAVVSQLDTRMFGSSKGRIGSKGNDKKNLVFDSVFKKGAPKTKAATRMQTMMQRKQGNKPNKIPGPSTSTTGNRPQSMNENEKDDYTSDAGVVAPGSKNVWYKRDTNKRFPQYLLFFSSVHAGYWVWYVTDFMSSITNAGLQISQEIGYIGCGFSFMMLGAASMYPKHLISEISSRQRGQGCVVKYHSLPFGLPDKNGTAYARGDLMLGNEVDRLKIKAHGGLTNASGHIAITVPDRTFNVLLDASNASSVNNDSLSRLLLGKIV
uniref:Uncharacterized protein n=1 Tax=Leptocylindrus danicus TaxID=163516 RepID=A0A7S2KZM7_9STRA|mmetsp:Transcript_29430/g.43223  ORF Transcript_29430/g.43223 Transcript_29430/m.43223 type:complete len:290 (+) Transcript_29430:129-998(+)